MAMQDKIPVRKKVPKYKIPADRYLETDESDLAGGINPDNHYWKPNPGYANALKGTGSTSKKSFDTQGLAESITPFISNIANSFRKPPMPAIMKPDTYTALQKVNLSNERNQVSTTINAANKATERNVPANASEAIKAFNRGEEFSRMNTINERESNTNVGISNAQAQMAAGTSAGNTAKVNKTRDEMVERSIAQQREQSANLANAGDKAMTMMNEKSKERTELGKAKILSSMYDKSGVLKRDNAIGQAWKDSGKSDPFGEDYKWLDKKTYGGMMHRVPRKKITY